MEDVTMRFESLLHRRRANMVLTIALALAVGIGITVPVTAATVTWNNSAGDGNWFESVNWSDNNGPTLDTDAIFPYPIPGTSTINLQGNLQVSEATGTLTFNASYTFNGGSLSLLASGGSITVNNTPGPVTAVINSILVGNLGFGLTKLGA